MFQKLKSDERSSLNISTPEINKVKKYFCVNSCLLIPNCVIVLEEKTYWN